MEKRAWPPWPFLKPPGWPQSPANSASPPAQAYSMRSFTLEIAPYLSHWLAHRHVMSLLQALHL